MRQLTAAGAAALPWLRLRFRLDAACGVGRRPIRIQRRGKLRIRNEHSSSTAAATTATACDEQILVVVFVANESAAEFS